MAKPRLVKVRALFYVLQQVMKRGCIGILIHPLICGIKEELSNKGVGRHLGFLHVGNDIAGRLLLLRTVGFFNNPDGSSS